MKLYGELSEILAPVISGCLLEPVNFEVASFVRKALTEKRTNRVSACNGISEYLLQRTGPILQNRWRFPPIRVALLVTNLETLLNKNISGWTPFCPRATAKCTKGLFIFPLVLPGEKVMQRERACQSLRSISPGDYKINTR